MLISRNWSFLWNLPNRFKEKNMRCKHMKSFCQQNTPDVLSTTSHSSIIYWIILILFSFSDKVLFLLGYIYSFFINFCWISIIKRTQKIGVWITISRRWIIRPIFIHFTLNTERYRITLEWFFNKTKMNFKLGISSRTVQLYLWQEKP